MALKALMLRKKIDAAKAKMDAMREREQELERRSAELEASIEEVSTEEEQQAVDELVNQYDDDKKAFDEEKKSLEEEISGYEEELRNIEAEQSKPVPHPAEKNEERKEHKMMENRAKFFGMSVEQRDAFMAREDVKDFLNRTRELGKQARSISGTDLLIPNVVLGLIKENIQGYSKLYKHVNVRSVPGKARQNIMGTIPEGVWTEMCASLNELSLSFSAVEVDGYKVGGYIAICNAILEDSDIALAQEIISALGQAIGLALDKAILYGTGTKMPLGIVTRLAQSSKPINYPSNGRPWADLHTTNLVTVAGKNDVELFKAIAIMSGRAKNNYSGGTKFWAMNEYTYTKMVGAAMSINASGAIVTGMNSTMPIIGGAIEVLNFIPDDVMIGGYGDLYLLAEREGATIAQSEHVRFLEDQTVFKGTARYDGIPAIPEGFIGISLGDTAPTADAVTFVADVANAG